MHRGCRCRRGCSDHFRRRRGQKMVRLRRNRDDCLVSSDSRGARTLCWCPRSEENRTKPVQGDREARVTSTDTCCKWGMQDPETQAGVAGGERWPLVLSAQNKKLACNTLQFNYTSLPAQWLPLTCTPHADIWRKWWQKSEIEGGKWQDMSKHRDWLKSEPRWCVWTHLGGRVQRQQRLWMVAGCRGNIDDESSAPGKETSGVSTESVSQTLVMCLLIPFNHLWKNEPGHLEGQKNDHFIKYRITEGECEFGRWVCRSPEGRTACCSWRSGRFSTQDKQEDNTWVKISMMNWIDWSEKHIY